MRKIRVIDYVVIALALVLFVFVALYTDHYKKTLILERVTVTIRDSVNSSFVQNDDILSVVLAQNIRTTEILCADIDIKRLKDTLEKNPYISNANCRIGYFKGNLKIDITQFTPIARVINADGRNYFLDTDGNFVSKNNRNGYDVIVITNHCPNLFADVIKKTEKKDNETEKIVTFAKLVLEDDFLNSLITQINITKKGVVELIPRVGRQVVELGRVDELEYAHERLEKLKVYLRKGHEEGFFERYSRIDISCDNQIVGTPVRK